jgi:two-component system chemotaxis response regulator CheB
VAKSDIIVIGASAGGLQVLRNLLGQLPADFPASIFVVWHLSRDFPSQLAQILGTSTSLPVLKAEHGDAIRPGHVYVARPDHHLMVGPGFVQVTRGPMENRFRPSIDVLFRSAALTYGPRVISIVLSGSLDDGASGSYAVKERGGITVVQDPVDATYFDMPVNTMKAVQVDHILPVAEMGQLLVRLTSGDAGESEADEREVAPPSRQMEIEVAIARGENTFQDGAANLGEPSKYTCPECHGTLNQIKEGLMVRFRCHAGHAYSLDTLLSSVTLSVEDSMWNTIRVLEESALVLQQMGRQQEALGATALAQTYYQKAQQAVQYSQRVRELVLAHEVLSEEKLSQQKPDEPLSRDGSQ